MRSDGRVDARRWRAPTLSPPRTTRGAWPMGLAGTTFIERSLPRSSSIPPIWRASGSWGSRTTSRESSPTRPLRCMGRTRAALPASASGCRPVSLQADCTTGGVRRRVYIETGYGSSFDDVVCLDGPRCRRRSQRPGHRSPPAPTGTAGPRPVTFFDSASSPWARRFESPTVLAGDRLRLPFSKQVADLWQNVGAEDSVPLSTLGSRTT